LKKYIKINLNILLFIFNLYPFLSEGQIVNDMLFGRSVSARTEAMGKENITLEGDVPSSFYNPALLGGIRGIELSENYSTPYYSLPKAYFSRLALAYRLNKRFTFAIRQHYLSYGLPLIPGGALHPYASLTTLGTAINFPWGICAGGNFNYLMIKLDASTPINSMFYDVGLYKKFSFLNSRSSHHFFSLASSISNLSNSKLNIEILNRKIQISMPVILRLGADYRFAIERHLLIDTLTTLSFIAGIEQRIILNTDYPATYTGCEIVFLELVCLRAGYYIERITPFTNLMAFMRVPTYGGGLMLPLHKLSRIPLNVGFDYAVLPHTSFAMNPPDWDLFHTFSFRLNLVL
jgi:hypothetical protein